MIFVTEEIPLAAEEWTITQGLVGYYRILKHAGIKVKTTDEGILFNPEHLRNFEHYYFDYFLDRFSVAKRDEQNIRRTFLKFRAESELKGSKEAKRRMQAAKKSLDETIKKTAIEKVEKKFEDSSHKKRLVEYATLIRNQKTYNPEMDKWIEEYIQALSEPNINEKLTLNYFKATVLGTYFGQVSFLNVSHTSKDIEEQKEIFRKDYIESLLADLELQQMIARAEDSDEIMKYLEISTHEMAKKLKTKFKKMTIQQIKDYVSNEINCCSFFDSQWAFEQYSELHFSPLSMSASKALNFYWNANGTLTIPVSKLAKLILFCAPAGASIIGGKSLFVQREGRFEQVIYANETYEIGRSKDKAFDEIIFDLIAEQKTKAQHTGDSYLILEYSSEYNAKKTDLQYLHLTPGLCSFFKEKNCTKWFSRLNYVLRNQIVHAFLRYQDSKHIIHNALRKKLQEQKLANEIVYACLLRCYYLFFVKGEGKMNTDLKTSKNRIWSAFYEGVAIKNIVEEGKIRSVAYRLLNAIRSNDKKMFLDTVMRLYMSVEKPLPRVFMNILDESNIDFASIGDSFIAGLISKEEEKINE
ncbi:type I-B CRISPR-associated protein Cas8b1/Cst1 [Bacillus cytotoxicus]|uniref:type I-B CRISPR-associated protein Cas8b1/Cst1 n=1 Tax=Bacillus cytotoxicus TaxID=580165 RepID=UPI00066090C3|nr:type I-B CRISPR-associated protein Cas8b1/Cst1 [Bacillus cytotoxicus]AWC32901.1 type I-B CRISPR-associated protein Cas8b1/Cst1 [Bacillus cytotoxicus]AWC36925.1 type I-B CRISPR-associated protein Cas8b1/Cst1 [Bacillus cytotoxicus]AWC61188.1 type I-B CRISPR-associated protein Cas8b1/Cst1 [Bacillus cytotoxicus]KMT48371.1 CRISPR-associated protein Cst1 [Bacillus cytotoxicus]HDR7309699.1 type I-B CRISPR-associated protein Cas8b1/Cst1 [Bacillus cytotoxicus]